VIDPYSWETYSLTVGDPALLHSAYRSGLIAQRDALLEIESRTRKWSMLDDGRTARVHAAPMKVVVAAQGIVAEGNRATLLVGFGDNLDDASFFSLSIPDAHELVRAVQHALDAALPGHGA